MAAATAGTGSAGTATGASVTTSAGAATSVAASADGTSSVAGRPLARRRCTNRTTETTTQAQNRMAMTGGMVFLSARRASSVSAR